MKRALFLSAGALALCSTVVFAQGAPESILPPGFDDPAPAPTPVPRPTPTPSGPAIPRATSSPVIQPLPTQRDKSAPSASAPSASSGESVDLPDNLPTLRQLESMSTDELDEFLGLKPKFDIPPAARRSLAEVGILGPLEGGLPTGSLANQPAALVRAALGGMTQPLISRWGHIMLRRALASRLAAPEGMDPANFAALRAAALNAMGEFAAARAIVQDVDTAEWNRALTDAALDAYFGTADIAGACPAVRLQGSERESGEWRMLQAICAAYAGEGVRANQDLNRIRSRGQAAPIDVALAQRFAGAAGRGRSGVNVEWNDVGELTPFRFALANAVGEEIPEGLRSDAGAYYQRAWAVGPMVSLAQRANAADRAAAEGILSASAMIDLYGQIYAEEGLEGDLAQTAARLRSAYIAGDPAARLAAIRAIWGGEGEPGYGRLVLTAYAAARMDPSDAFAEAAPSLIASMLTAGLERDALRWAPVVPNGGEGWALLALAAPTRSNPVSSGQLDTFIDEDDSADQRKSQFLLAGLAGLGRLDEDDVESFSSRLGVNLTAPTRWTRAIDQAAAVDNKALVAFLVGLGMQGERWDQMTARHLYHIVAALNRVGLEAEARMIAAEAVARG